jgi:hypothetical protein
VGPQPLPRMPLGGIGREPLQLDAVSRAAIGLDHVTAVHRRPTLKDGHAAGHLPQQVRQEGDDILCLTKPRQTD